jgi:Tol biopolymer transport system component
VEFPKPTATFAPSPPPTTAPEATSLPSPSETASIPPEAEAPEEPGGRIVFVCQVFKDANRDQICIMNADGSEQRRLTADDAADFNFPSWSPDGNSIIYSGYSDGLYGIYETDLEGETRLLLADTFSAFAPEISPDGSQVLFTRTVGEFNAVWVMDRNGGNPRQIFGPPQGPAWFAVWRPDGQRILFASNSSGENQLYTMAPDGSDMQIIGDLPNIPGDSNWSPDGSTIATYAGEPWSREIYLVGADGSNLQAITSGGNNLSPGFSPDGNWIVFTSYRDRFGDENGCEIYRMRRDGSQVQRLTDNDYCDWQPRWGPG